ncbi:MAG: nitroreductase [Gemmatimonadetes bacterium]|nr:nitroreductase [Gemmatimonadota bacterium]
MVDALVAPYLDAIDEFPVEGTAERKLRAALRYAVLAPSSHNSQPWLFRLTDDAVEVLADRSRALRVADPRDRELILSCGAALFNLRVTLRHFGYMGTVDLMPDRRDADLLARVTLGAEYEATIGEHALFDAISLRRTHRFRFQKRSVPDHLRVALERGAKHEGAWFQPVDLEDAREAVAGLVAEADRVQMADPAFRRELAAWMHGNRSGRRDGMPGYALGLGEIMSAAAPLAIRTFDLGKGRAAKDKELALGSPLLAVLGTDGDAPADWLAAGQALEHILLRAAIEEVSASFLNQPIEVPDLRLPLAALIGRSGYPQVLLRMGYGRRVKATPRRRVEEVTEPATR